jgi:hypothetical protein
MFCVSFLNPFTNLGQSPNFHPSTVTFPYCGGCIKV